MIDGALDLSQKAENLALSVKFPYLKTAVDQTKRIRGWLAGDDHSEPSFR